jgi:hypothetical protein
MTQMGLTDQIVKALNIGDKPCKKLQPFMDVWAKTNAKIRLKAPTIMPRSSDNCTTYKGTH